MSSAEKKLLDFNPNKEGVDAVEEFQNIVDSLSTDDKKILGKKFDIWKTSCLYYFLTSAKNKVGLTKSASIIIQKYKECQAEAYRTGNELSRFIIG